MLQYLATLVRARCERTSVDKAPGDVEDVDRGQTQSGEVELDAAV
jgi:hypothetical protein